MRRTGRLSTRKTLIHSATRRTPSSLVTIVAEAVAAVVADGAAISRITKMDVEATGTGEVATEDEATTTGAAVTTKAIADATTTAIAAGTTKATVAGTTTANAAGTTTAIGDATTKAIGDATTKAIGDVAMMAIGDVAMTGTVDVKMITGRAAAREVITISRTIRIVTSTEMTKAAAVSIPQPKQRVINEPFH